MISTDTLLTFYDYFYNKIYNTPELKIPRTDRYVKICSSFLELLKKEHSESLGNEFLFTYSIFQFSYWERLEIKNQFNNRIQLSFIYGKKAFERYNKRNVEYDWQFESSPILKKYSLVKSDLIKPIESNKYKKSIRNSIDTEAPFKLAYFNTIDGFNTCRDYSTLFNHRSKICSICIYSDQCKERLKTMYPSVYRDRGYK